MPHIHSLKRPAIERMLRIHQLLKRGNFPNCSTLSKELEVSSKTISRDIDFMRDRMLLPIDYAAESHGYYYTREVQSMPTIDISEGELLALSIARKSMASYKGTPFEKPLSRALDKLSASLPETLTANLDELSETISFKGGRAPQLDEGLLNTFARAALDRQEISFDYKKLGRPTSERRRLQVYHLTNYQGKWYAIGRDMERSATRTFLVSRSRAAKLEAQRYDVPQSFSAEEYLNSSFGIYSPEGQHKVRIEFGPPLAEYIAENIWHPSQDIEHLDDERIVVSFKLGSLIEIRSWIQGWGAEARVLEPSCLADDILENARKVAALYK